MQILRLRNIRSNQCYLYLTKRNIQQYYDNKNMLYTIHQHFYYVLLVFSSRVFVRVAPLNASGRIVHLASPVPLCVYGEIVHIT